MTALLCFIFIALSSELIQGKTYETTKSCEIPIPLNGVIEKLSDDGLSSKRIAERMVPPDTEILVTCNPGYVIESGPNRAVCLRLGIWSGRIGDCSPISSKSRITCVVPDIDNGIVRIVSLRRRLGKRAEDRVPVGTRIHLRCDRDFFLTEGSYETTCGSDGTWTVNLAKCAPLMSTTEDEDCGEEPKIQHGTVVNRTPGTRAIECDQGYALIGSGIVKCQKDGRWSYADNACQRTCNKVPEIANGFVAEGSSIAGSEREVGCYTGFEMSGPRKIECRNSTGTWSEPGKCIKSCGEPPAIMNAALQDGINAVGAERRINCNDGFAMTGISIILCNHNGRWVVGGMCRKACNGVPEVLNGAVKSGESSVGSERHVACDVGFVLKGPAVIRCGDDSKWTEPGFCKKESIHMAAEMGDVEVVKHLIKSQPELIEQANAYGDSPLWRAAHNGQVEVVKLLLSEGANIETRGLYGRTPLHEAASLGHVEVVKHLIKNGANVYAKSNIHDSEHMPIHLAAFEGHLEVVRALLEANPDLIDQKDMHGRNPMDLARISSHDRASDIVHFLRSKLCDSDYIIPNGHLGNGSSSIGGERSVHCNEGFVLTGATKVRCKSAGHWSEPGKCISRECSFSPGVVNGRISDGGSSIGSERVVSCLQGFVLSGASKIRCERNGQWSTAGTCEPAESIFWAATMGHDQVVRVLLEKSPELLEERDRSNTTVLAIAASYGQTSIVEYLLTKTGINVEARDKDGRTPLALAASKGHLRIVKMLVKRGANYHAKSYSDDYEDSPIHFAAMAGHSDVVEYLVGEERALIASRNKDGDQPIHRAVVGGHSETVKSLLDLGADIEAQNNDGWTPLCHAAAEGNIEIVRLLTDRGANVYARSNVDDDEDMPIHLASYFGHLNIVSFLIERKPDLMVAKNREGESPINRAAVGGHTAVVEYLLSRGVDIETRGFRGRTPLHEAASKGHLKLVKMLLRNNANITARSDRDADRGSLPIHLASYFGQLDVVRYLIEIRPDLVDARNSRGQTPLEHAIAGGSLHNAEDVVRYLTERVGPSSVASVLP